MAHYATTTKNDTSIGAAGGGISFSHDSGSNANRVLLVWVAVNGGGAHTIDSATYNGVSMTALGAMLTQATCRMRGFALVGPASGSNTVEVTFSTGSSDRSVCIVAQTYDGYDGYENYTTAQGLDGSSPFNADVTVSSATGDLVVAAAAAANNRTWTAGADQTERADIQRTTNGDISLTASEEAGAASVAMTHAASGSINFVVMGVSLTAASGGGGASAVPVFMRSYRQRRAA